MPRTPQGRGQRGSQLWLQKLIGCHPEDLDARLTGRVGGLAPGERIEWRSPLESDEWAEYYDAAFLERLGVAKLPKRALSNFWPASGPRWDGLGRTPGGELILVEAKSHIAEMTSKGAAESQTSRDRIKGSLDEVKHYLGARAECDWTQPFYQFANRLAHLYLLRVENGLPAWLVFIYFVGDVEMRGPLTEEDWCPAIADAHKALGLQSGHALAPFVIDAFVDVADLAREGTPGASER